MLITLWIAVSVLSVVLIAQNLLWYCRHVKLRRWLTSLAETINEGNADIDECKDLLFFSHKIRDLMQEALSESKKRDELEAAIQQWLKSVTKTTSEGTSLHVALQHADDHKHLPFSREINDLIFAARRDGRKREMSGAMTAHLGEYLDEVVKRVKEDLGVEYCLHQVTRCGARVISDEVCDLSAKNVRSAVRMIIEDKRADDAAVYSFGPLSPAFRTQIKVQTREEIDANKKELEAAKRKLEAAKREVSKHDQ